MVPAQPLKMCLQRTTKLGTVFDVEDVIYKLEVKLALARKTAAGVAPDLNLFIGHDLNAQLLRHGGRRVPRILGIVPFMRRLCESNS